MIESNLAYDYIADIPWESNPAFAFSLDSKTYLLAFQNVLPTIPVRNSRISFNDDIWDFNPYFDNSNNATYRFNFEDVPNDMKDFFKFFVLYGIMGKRKVSTMQTRFAAAKSVILKIVSATSHKSIFLITTDDIIAEIETRNTGNSSKYNLYQSTYQFCKFITYNYKLALNIDLKMLDEFSHKNQNLTKTNREKTKLPDIPDEYFNAILETSTRIMRDPAASYNTRVIACIIVMLSQLGLRIGDLLILKIDQLHSMKLPKIGQTAYYIRYKAHKPSRPHDRMLEFDIFCNKLCMEAYETMLELRKSCEASKDCDYLFIVDYKNSHFLSHLTHPLSNGHFSQFYEQFFYTYLRDMCLRDWGKAATSRTIRPLGDNRDVTIQLPDTRQFRVHLCTKLYENNVPLAYIQRYMGHLSEYMMGYYVRPKDTYQENIQYSEKVIKEIAGDGLTPLGGAFGAELRSSIQRFIEENHFNVKTDIKEIVAAMGDKVVIRGKTGGVCIKTSLMPCSKDARSNELLCAYNLCPNLFHFYYMVDVTYMDFQALQESYAAMKETGQIKAAQKELNKLKDLCRRRLIPELDELDKELFIKGETQIISRYPSLVDVISGRETIRKEIELWMKKE